VAFEFKYGVKVNLQEIGFADWVDDMLKQALSIIRKIKRKNDTGSWKSRED
jgi:hypothetical protein